VWQRHQRDLWIVAIVVVGLFVALADVRGARAGGPRHFTGAGGLTRNRSICTGDSALGRWAVALVWGKIEFDRARASWGVVFGLVFH